MVGRRVMAFSLFLYNQMSLTSILKEIERVNKKHREVERRYNRKSKNCPRQEDLQRQQREDQHIFGYSHSQILGMFRQSKCENTEETRPCTAADAETRPCTAAFASSLGRPPAAVRRAQSAVKLGSYRQQYNFLFKEDIFDENHEKMRRTLPFREVNCEKNERKMSKMLVDLSVPRTVSKMHSKSIRAERINFMRSFDENLNRMQGSKRKKLNKVSKNHVFYTRTALPASPTATHQGEDFFRLTKAPEREQAKKMKVVLSNSVDNLKELEQLINVPESGKLADFTRESSVGRYPPLLETNFATHLPPKFTLTCITMDTLQSVRLKLTLRNGNIALEESRETVSLAYVFQQLLASHTMVHLVFHSEGTLLYEETLVGQSFRNVQSREHEILLLMYYLKRFLLFDGKSTLRSVRESADLLLKSNIDLPDDFADFAETFTGKLCRVYDTDQRLYQFALGPTLANALASITAFKKEMGFGQKVVKLKHGSREEFKKYLYNWEYFYICP